MKFDVIHGLFSQAPSARALGMLAASVFVSAVQAQTVVQSLNFETFTAGAGTLAPTFSVSAGGGAYGSGNAATDTLTGVIASSVLGSGQAGYLGGAGTGLMLSSTAGPLFLGAFPGSSSANATTTVQLRGSATPVLAFDVDFAVSRSSSANQQSFSFAFFDAQNAQGTGSAAHSQVLISPDNQVWFLDNANSVITNTGRTLLNDVAYHLRTTVDYTTSTWSATLSGGGMEYDLVTGRSINSVGYTLSGFTTPTNGAVNLNMAANSASSSNAAFADRLVFDNYTVSAVPEPATMAAVAGLAGLLAAVWLRRRASTKTS